MPFKSQFQRRAGSAVYVRRIGQASTRPIDTKEPYNAKNFCRCSDTSHLFVCLGSEAAHVLLRWRAGVQRGDRSFSYRNASDAFAVRRRRRPVHEDRCFCRPRLWNAMDGSKEIAEQSTSSLSRRRNRRGIASKPAASRNAPNKKTALGRSVCRYDWAAPAASAGSTPGA